MEPRSSCVLGKCFAPELHAQTFLLEDSVSKLPGMAFSSWSSCLNVAVIVGLCHQAQLERGLFLSELTSSDNFNSTYYL